ncbi:MAG: gliding motility-associated C-terminal domain-containing protein [Bacteroidota bacterium]
MREHLYVFLLVFSNSLLFAQAVSKEGRFSADFGRGCVPLRVNITELTPSGTANRLYFYGDRSSETTSTSHVYVLPGTYQIVQIDSDLTPQTDTLTIEVFEPTETQFSLEKCNLNGVTVTSEDQTYDMIRVYFTPTDSVTLQFGEQASFVYPTIATRTFQTKGIYTDGKENCTLFTHQVDPLIGLTSPGLVNVTVKETCRDFFTLSLELDAFDSLILYQVELEQNSLGSSMVFEGNIQDNPLTIPGINFDRTEPEYCIKINAIDVCSGGRTEGIPRCEPITEFSLTPFSNLYSSYTGNGIFINLDSIGSGNLLVYRKLDSDPDFQLRTSVQNAFSDPLGTLSRKYFYRIDYLDSCNEVLYSIETNPPLIDSDQIRENTYALSLTDPVNVISENSQSFYEVGNVSTTTEPITSSEFMLELSLTNGTRQFLQARVEYENNITVFSNQIPYRFTPVVQVPKAFTPNGDQLNDTLEFFGLPSETAFTKIYTRWGQLIYSSSEPSPGWDGFINGNLAPEGTYLYEIIFEDSDGERVTQKGTFALLKK